MNKPRLLMTCPWPKYAQIAQARGYHLIGLWHQGKGAEATFHAVAKQCDELYSFDLNDTDKMAALIDHVHQQQPLDIIYHLGRDEQMQAAYQIAERYGKALNPLSSIAVINDKYQTRALLNAHGLSAVRFESCESVAQTIEKAPAFGFPCVLKPTALSASQGVFLCQSTADLDQWQQRMSAYDYQGTFLIEEYLVGAEVSVETLSYQGQHQVIGITDKVKTKPPLFVELGHVHPSQLPKETQAQIRELVVEFLTIAEYQFGPTHTEIILTEQGPKMIESQPRLAGDKIPVITQLASGVCMESAIFDLLEQIPPPTDVQAEQVATIRYFNWPCGHLQHLTGVDEVRALAGAIELHLNVKVGQIIEPVTDSFNRHGYVIVSAENSQQLATRLTQIEQLLQPEIIPVAD